MGSEMCIRDRVICIQTFSAQTLAEHLSPKSILYFIQGTDTLVQYKISKLRRRMYATDPSKNDGAGKRKKKILGELIAYDRRLNDM